MYVVRAFLFVGGVRRIQDLHKNVRNLFRGSGGFRSEFDIEMIDSFSRSSL